MDAARAQRYRRHDLIDWFSQDEVAAARVAVVGAGAVGNEVVKNLVLLGAGTIDVFDFDEVEPHNLTRSILLRESDVGRPKAEAVAARASGIDPNVRVNAVTGDFWRTLSLGRLRSYTCAVSAVDNFEARLRLNQMCLIAGVDLVNAGLDSRWATVESFPFGSAGAGTACYECTLPASAYARIAERYSCGGLRRRAHVERRIPTTTVTASVAGALAASAALRFGQDEPPRSRRTLLDTLGGTAGTVTIERRDDCPGCGMRGTTLKRLRTRNRWSRPDPGATVDPSLMESVVRLSDALVTSYECAVCGPLEAADRYVNRRAGDFDETIATCPSCAEPAVQVGIQDAFTLGELVERFGDRPAPVKFALVEVDGAWICLDFEEDDSP